MNVVFLVYWLLGEIVIYINGGNVFVCCCYDFVDVLLCIVEFFEFFFVGLLMNYFRVEYEC